VLIYYLYDDEINVNVAWIEWWPICSIIQRQYLKKSGGPFCKNFYGRCRAEVTELKEEEKEGKHPVFCLLWWCQQENMCVCVYFSGCFRSLAALSLVLFLLYHVSPKNPLPSARPKNLEYMPRCCCCSCPRNKYIINTPAHTKKKKFFDFWALTLFDSA
jgi:hypothetical protein